jgi:pimeloyl-ACP methyl ester carboxylesterase
MFPNFVSLNTKPMKKISSTALLLLMAITGTARQTKTNSSCTFPVNPAAFSLEQLGLMKNIQTVPLILINGDSDPYVPKTDVARFEGIPNIETKIVPNSGHCAAPKFGEVMPWVTDWLKVKLNC